MTTVSQAYAAIRSRLEANPVAGLAIYWQNELATLPDEPAPFAFVELVTDNTFIAGFGGGRLRNLWRTEGRIEGHVYVEKGAGLQAATDFAESIAGLFRSYRDAAISCFAGHVEVEGDVELAEPAGNYYAAHAVIDLHFDLEG